MKARDTRKGNIKVTLTQDENRTLNAILQKYIDKAGKFPRLYPHAAFARKLRDLDIKDAKPRG